jgi:hypothetical protein
MLLSAFDFDLPRVSTAQGADATSGTGHRVRRGRPEGGRVQAARGAERTWAVVQRRVTKSVSEGSYEARCEAERSAGPWRAESQRQPIRKNITSLNRWIREADLMQAFVGRPAGAGYHRELKPPEPTGCAGSNPAPGTSSDLAVRCSGAASRKIEGTVWSQLRSQFARTSPCSSSSTPVCRNLRGA